MREIKIFKGKQFEVIVYDTFTGGSIIIDNHNISKKALSKDQYTKLEKVQEMINSDKPLYLFSQQ